MLFVKINYSTKYHLSINGKYVYIRNNTFIPVIIPQAVIKNNECMYSWNSCAQS